MKIGDKVRFLSEIGGGRIAGIKGNIVLVEDEDGFQIPMPVNDVVIVEDDAKYDINNVSKQKGQVTKSVTTGKMETTDTKTVSDNIEDEQKKSRCNTCNYSVEERKGGNVLNCYLAFVPVDVKSFMNTRFECYIVNDSNYYIYYTYLIAEGASWTLRSAGEIEPNTKYFIEEFGREDLNEFDRVAVQILSYKRNMNFIMKPLVDVQIRIDKVKFYKLHAFRENDFFEQAALLYQIVENDKVMRSLVVDAKKLKQEMYKKTQTGQTVANIDNKDGYVRRYDDGKKGNPFVFKHKNDDVVVVDLHSNALLDTIAGMSASDILDYQISTFHKTIENYKSDKGRKIIFVHGKGDGVLRHAIINELKYRYKNYQYQDASFQEYGYGATQITIK